MTITDAGTTAARVRAAQGWADLTDDQLAAKLGVSKRTLSRFKAGAEVSYERRTAIAEATGVPAWFMESGFENAAAPDDPVLAERVEALEARVQAALELARTRDERVGTLELQMRTILSLSRGRIGADLAEAARQQEPGEGPVDVGDTGRSGRHPGDGDR